MSISPSESTDEIERWTELAHEARYSMSRLAQKLRMNTKQLRRLFRERFKCLPKDFFDSVRARQAAAASRAGFSAKEVADAFHYRDAAHLNHALKKHLGLTPAQLCPRRTRSPFATGADGPREAARRAGIFLQAKDTNLQGADIG
ncbi:MAG: helix-turn-helix domain-containing protein [Candidatus Didemnitutus sp.]|nr:helix-turn-helix domain-containing protein [Candidatus Didemnitutus sp.]